MTIQDEKKECEEGSNVTKKELKRCKNCGGELSANELFTYGGLCYICEGSPFMNDEGEIRRCTRDDKMQRAWERELKINV